MYSPRRSIRSLKKEREDEKGQIKLANVLFAFVGVGYLFPFSALTQPVDYWALLFPDFNIDFAITNIFFSVNLCVLFLLVFFGGIPNFTLRIVGGFSGQLLVLLVVPTSYFLGLQEHQNEMVVLGATAFAAVVTALIDSSAISLVAQYPVAAQEAFQFGIGLSTLIGSVYRDATKIMFPPDQIVASSLLYFYSGAATIAFCICCYFRLMAMPLSKKCLAAAKEEAEHQKERRHSGVLPNELTALIAPSSPNGTMENKTTESLSGSPKEPLNNWDVFRKVWFNELMVALLFTSTLALWPPLVTEIRSFNFPSLQASGWFPLLLLTIFSMLDCLGRLLVRYRLFFNRHNIWIAVLGRITLFPLILCSVWGVVFTHDAFSVLFVGLLGLTNGYVGTLCIILVNECLETQEEIALAGTYTGFFLNSGLVAGATIGSFLETII